MPMRKLTKLFVNNEDKSEEILNALYLHPLNEEVKSRCSSNFLIQLYAGVLTRTEDPFRIIHEICVLEGVIDVTQSMTKEPTMFTRKPELKSLWHKHYFGCAISVMAINLKNALHNYGIPYLDNLLAESKRAGQEHYLNEKEINHIVHEVVNSHFERRLRDKELTGHWIIYAKYNDKNYYLCLGKHTDDEKLIRKNIDKLCVPDFPFLNDILEPLPFQ